VLTLWIPSVLLNLHVNKHEFKNLIELLLLSFSIVTYPGFAWLIRRFYIWWSNLLDLYATCYNISQITVFHWTLSTSDHISIIHCCPLYSVYSDLVYDCLLIYDWLLLYNVMADRPLQSRIHGNVCWPLLFTETSSWFPRIHLYGYVFVNSFSSNESTCHSMLVLWKKEFSNQSFRNSVHILN
jgi:hypothetical protein